MSKSKKSVRIALRNQGRQGDVYIERVDSIPERFNKKIVAKHPLGNVLAEGEVTGHNHTIDAKISTLFAATETGASEFYLQVDKPGTIVHQEHGPIAVQDGIYHVVRQKEYDPTAIRNVAD